MQDRHIRKEGHIPSLLAWEFDYQLRLPGWEAVTRSDQLEFCVTALLPQHISNIAPSTGHLGKCMRLYASRWYVHLWYTNDGAVIDGSLDPWIPYGPALTVPETSH